jgi:hypothetical protein
MYVDTAKTGPYTRHLLRESYREDGKVKHRTIANLSGCSAEEINAIKLALRHKGQLGQLLSDQPEVSIRNGLSVGAVWLVYDLARQLGIQAALGHSRQGKLALWQVIARVIEQGSRLSAVRLASRHACCDILNLDGFNEDDLYANLAWLDGQQRPIEDRLFAALPKDATGPGLYLYDVTSSYLEGVCNELSAFGYNRDGKKGKRQIVIGLLCNGSGRPLSIELFPGNTADPATLAGQVRKVAARFGGGEVTFVGDRGMIKSRQIEDLAAHGFHYITAITKPQIEALLSAGVLMMGLFDEKLAEVLSDDGPRYVLRRNPTRAAELAAGRQDKLRTVQRQVDLQNAYLQEHPKADPAKAAARITARCRTLRIDSWATASVQARVISLKLDPEALAERHKLDGCYVLKTDLAPRQADAETVHDRYKDLALVEWAFRTSKTVQLEMRPVHVRLARSTRGHALVVMLAYRIVQELAQRWRDIDVTVQEGLDELKMLCAMDLRIAGQSRANCVPLASESAGRLLAAANVRLPQSLPSRGVTVATRKKLPGRRITS